MSAWIAHIDDLRRGAKDCVIVTVAVADGSTPREAGAKMIVTAEQIFGTVGGGHLEYKAVEAAREMLSGAPTTEPALHRLPLGPALGQCCGGNATLLLDPLVAEAGAGAWIAALAAAQDAARPCVLVTRAEGRAGRLVVDETGVTGSLGDGPLDAFAVDAARDVLERADRPEARIIAPEWDGVSGPGLLLEPIRPPDFNIVLFGAGHVAQSLVPVLAELPCLITWVDGRAQLFPEAGWHNVAVEVSEAPEYDVDAAPADSYFLVMTYSHALDLRLCERILRRDDFAYFGLIGSTTKRRRFEKRLRNKGIAAGTLARMSCPIGVPGVKGKHPREIAIAVAAEILRVRGTRAAAKTDDEKRETLSA